MNFSITRLRIVFGVLFALYFVVLVTPGLYYTKSEMHAFGQDSTTSFSFGMYYTCETWPEGGTNIYGEKSPCFGQSDHTYPPTCVSEAYNNDDTAREYCDKHRTFQVFGTVGAGLAFIAFLLLIVPPFNQFATKRTLLVLIWSCYIVSLIGLSVYINLQESPSKAESNAFVSFTYTYSYAFASWVIAVAGSLIFGILLSRAEVETGSTTGYFLSGA